MFRLLLLVLASSILIGPLNSAVAQRGRRYFPETDYRRLGLEQAWSSQVQLDSSRSQVESVVLQVVGMDSYEQLQASVYRVFEVAYNGHAMRFSENDVDASGRRLGRDEAQRLAEKQVILLEARGFQPKLTTRDIPPTTIYVQSGTGTLHAMDAENGKTLWAVTVGNPRWPMMLPAANDRYVATVNGSSLYLLDRETGEPVWDRPLGMNPSSSLAMSTDLLFVPGMNGQVEAYSLPAGENDHQASRPWIYQSGGRITATPAVGSTTVSWATDRGQMFVAALEGPEMLYRRQTGGPIFGRAAFLPPDRLVIASTDGYVTAINEQTGALQWDFSTGFDLYQTPICQADQTYAVTRRNELFCVSSTDGTELWMAPRVEQVLACGKERVYVRGTGGRLEALDKHTGKRLASLDAPAYSVAYHNPLTDRIYLLTNDGGLLCLREIDAYYPAIYRPLPAPEEDRQAPTTSEQPSGDEPAVPATAPGDAGDIFGGDIFGEAPALDSEPAPESDTPADPPTDDGADEEEFDDPFDFG